MIEETLTLVMTAHIPTEGVELFQEYERKILPLLENHNAKLEKRLSNGDGTVEIHILNFANKQAFEAFSLDPDRLQYTDLFDRSGAQVELRQMSEVE